MPEPEYSFDRFLESVEDLEEIKRAVIRETVIRNVMADTGEPRELVAEMISQLDAEPANLEQVVVWSHHHRAWWGPSGRGYRAHAADAGRYDPADKRYLNRGCGCCLVPDVAIPAPPLRPRRAPAWLRRQINEATLERVEAGEVNLAAVELIDLDDVAMVDGIRPHLPLTLEEDRECQGMAESVAPVTREDLKRQGLLPG